MNTTDVMIKLVPAGEYLRTMLAIIRERSIEVYVLDMFSHVSPV